MIAVCLFAAWAVLPTDPAAAAPLGSTFPSTVSCPAGANTCSPGPVVAEPNGTGADLPCQVEQFPAGGTPRSASSVPYEIPFTATLGPDPSPLTFSDTTTPPTPTYPATPDGGWLEISGTSQLIAGAKVDVILGGPVVNGMGQVYAAGCGRVSLPSEVGGLGADSYPATGSGGQVNPNFVFAPETPVSIGISIPGIPLSPTVGSGIVAYGEADGFLSSDIQLKPAANGGLNVDFYSTAKSTTDLSSLLVLISQLNLGNPAGGTDCSIAIGDLNDAGLPVPPAGIDGLTYQQATTPVHLSTTQSVPDPNTGHPDSGQPVTGPIAPSNGHAQDSAVLVANNFPVAAIDTNMPPSTGFPGTATCSSTNAELLNKLIGLPNPAGANYFYAPGTFGVFTSS